MLYPKKLNVVLDSEILEEISRELSIDIKDVKNTYKGHDYDARKDYNLNKFLLNAIEQVSGDNGWADLKNS